MHADGHVPSGQLHWCISNHLYRVERLSRRRCLQPRHRRLYQSGEGGDASTTNDSCASGTCIGSKIPASAPIYDVVASPDGFPIQAPTDVVFTAKAPYDVSTTPPNVQLERVTAEGTFVAVEGSMADDGQNIANPSVASDRVFTLRKTFAAAQPTYLYFRIRADDSTGTHYSEPFVVGIFAETTDAESDAMSTILDGGYLKRHNLTHSESALWRHLSGSRLGVAFRRQVPVDRHIVDFLAPAIRLVVEVDGLWHHRRVAFDERRDRRLIRLGYRVLHLDAALVMQQPSVAVERIREAIAAAQSR
jgi:very-short-patch-repair endonuclease